MEQLALDNKSAADIAFTDLDATVEATGANRGRFRARQVSSIIRTIPAIMLGNLLACLLGLWISALQPDNQAITIWIAVLTGLTGLALVPWYRLRKAPVPRTASRRAIKKIEASTIAFGLVWAVFPAIAFPGAPLSVQFLASCMIFAAISLVAFNMFRVPNAALLFVSLVAGSAVKTFLEHGGDARNLLALSMLGFAVVMAILVVYSFRASLKNALDVRQIERQSEIIKLLLHDFEASARDWLWETDAKGRIIYASNRLAELAGTSLDDVIGKELWEVAGGRDICPKWVDFYDKVNQHGHVEALELPARIGGAMQRWQLRARPLFDSQGTFIGYRGVGTDITQDHQLKQDIITAKEAAERASEHKSQFLAVMSHELRTPLNAIVGFSEIIAEQREGPVNNDNYISYARDIQQSSAHLSVLISDILDMTRIEKGALKLVEQEIDAVELARVAVKMCQAAARASKITIAEYYPDRQVEIFGDLTRLKQVLINLVTNAVKFTPAGGTVEISLVLRRAGAVEFVITDTGIGIDKADLERVFEPFAQADQGSARQFNGAGLGLAISRNLARLHDGDIHLSSTCGQGTIARLVLPAERNLTCKKPARKAA